MMSAYGDTPYGMTASERERSRTCRAQHRAAWWVRVRHANYSAFNGGRFTPSDYSEIQCGRCSRIWRTKAAYADDLPDDIGLHS